VLVFCAGCVTRVSDMVWVGATCLLVAPAVAKAGLVVEGGGDPALRGVYKCVVNSTVDGVCQV